MLKSKHLLKSHVSTAVRQCIALHHPRRVWTSAGGYDAHNKAQLVIFLRSWFTMDYFRSLNANDMADSMKKFGSQTATFFSRAKQVRFLLSYRYFEWHEFFTWIFVLLVHRGATWHLGEDCFWCKIWVTCREGRSHQILDRKTSTTNRGVTSA